MSNQVDLSQGTLDMLILKAVSPGGLHGYGVLLRLQRLTGGRFQSAGIAPIPALYRLERKGLIASEWGESENKRKAKFYKLTAAGRRTNEIGIRMALGATNRGIVWMILREGFALAGTGVFIGIPAVLAMGQVAKASLYGVGPLRSPCLVRSGVAAALFGGRCGRPAKPPRQFAGSINGAEARIVFVTSPVF